MDDGRIAQTIAREAAKHLLEVRQANASLDAGALKDLGDQASQALIARRLTQLVPKDAVLSEEAADTRQRLSASRVWIIDPLDGTREYSEGREDWAVHVALVEKGSLVVGAVALGGDDHVLVSTEISAAPPRLRGPVRIAVSRTRPPELVESIAQALDAELVPMGSAGVKISAVVRGEVDAYVHAGGQYEWDSAAPVAVARAAGLHTSRIDGSPLIYNRQDPWLPDLVVCRREVAVPIMRLIEESTVSNERKEPGDHA